MQKGYANPNKLNEYTTEVGAKLKVGKMSKALIITSVRNFISCVDAINKKELEFKDRLEKHYRKEREVWAKSLGVTSEWLDAMPKGLLSRMQHSSITSEVTKRVPFLEEGYCGHYDILVLLDLAVPEKYQHMNSEDHSEFEKLKRTRSISEEMKNKYKEFCETNEFGKLCTDINTHFRKKHEVVEKLCEEALSCGTPRKWVELRPEIENYFPESAYAPETKKVPSVGASKVDALLEGF